MPKEPAKIGFWHMVRDVLIASMNKGQFPLAMVGLIVMLMILKMPPADVSKVAFEIIANLKTGHYVGYAFGLASLAGWFFHSRYQRRTITDEMARLADERNARQKTKLGKGKVRSSK